MKGDVTAMIIFDFDRQGFIIFFDFADRVAILFAEVLDVRVARVKLESDGVTFVVAPI